MSNSEKSQALSSLLGRVREHRPLVHHITNMVVMNDTANITLAIGASPVMAHALEEVEEMVKLASVLLLNIGTLTPEQIEAMLRAGKRANELGIPIVLDPVGREPPLCAPKAPCVYCVNYASPLPVGMHPKLARWWEWLRRPGGLILSRYPKIARLWPAVQRMSLVAL